MHRRRPPALSRSPLHRTRLQSLSNLNLSLSPVESMHHMFVESGDIDIDFDSRGANYPFSRVRRLPRVPCESQTPAVSRLIRQAEVPQTLSFNGPITRTDAARIRLCLFGGVEFGATVHHPLHGNCRSFSRSRPCTIAVKPRWLLTTNSLDHHKDQTGFKHKHDIGMRT